MLGLGYKSFQYYSYSNPNELKKALEFNNIGKQEFNEDNKIIKYEIDRKKCIRLSDLFYWIKTKFIKFHYGQLLNLFENLLIHTQYMEQQNIDFIYLDEDRIWLILEENSQYLNIVESKIKYRIAFTGFQCPLYDLENYNNNNKAIITIHLILIEFLNDLISDKVLLNQHVDQKSEISKILSNIKPDQSNQIIKEIYQPLKEQFEKCIIKDSLLRIQDLKKKFNYDSITQTIEKDKQKGISNKDQFSKQIKQYLQEVISNFNDNQMLLEFILCFIIQTLANQLNLQNLDTIAFQDYNSYKQQYQEIETSQLRELKESLFKNWIIQLLEEEIQKYNKVFKFQFNEQEISIMYEQIMVELLKEDILKYFQNSCWYLIKKFNNQGNIQFKNQNSNKFQIMKYYVQPFVQQLVGLNIQLKILELIYSLI